jgi:hypothetical protein
MEAMKKLILVMFPKEVLKEKSLSLLKACCNNILKEDLEIQIRILEENIMQSL